MPSDSERKVMREKLARECLRQIWQRHSAGGISHRRSKESALLEDAMSLLGADYTYSDMADNRHDDFVELVNSEVFAMGLESQQEPKP